MLGLISLYYITDSENLWYVVGYLNDKTQQMYLVFLYCDRLRQSFLLWKMSVVSCAKLYNL